MLRKCPVLLRTHHFIQEPVLGLFLHAKGSLKRGILFDSAITESNAQLSHCSHCRKHLLNKSLKNLLVLIHKLCNYWKRRSVHPYLRNRPIFLDASVCPFMRRLNSTVWMFFRDGKSFTRGQAVNCMPESRKQTLLAQHVNMWICNFAIDNSGSQNLTRHSSQAHGQNCKFVRIQNHLENKQTNIKSLGVSMRDYPWACPRRVI